MSPVTAASGSCISALPLLLHKNRQEVLQTALISKSEAFQLNKKTQAFLGVSESNWRKGEYYANSSTAPESTHTEAACSQV